MLNKKLLIGITILVSLIIALSGYVFFQKLTKGIQADKEIELTAIAELKIGQLVQWKSERIADIRVLSESPIFNENVEKWLENPTNKELKEHLSERLTIPQREYNYKSIFIVSTNGQVILTTDKDTTHFDKSYFEETWSSLTQTDQINSSFFYCALENAIHYDLLAPIFDKKNEIIAILVFRVEPSTYLYPLIQSWPTPSKTSETLLIRKEKNDVLFLNELRHQKGTALNLRIDLTTKTLPAVMAAEGTVGVVTGTDYRGMQVVAYVAPVPGTDWFMVSKVDKKELYEELASKGTFILLTTILIIFLVGAGITLYYTLRQKNLYRSLWETEEEFKTTLYSIGDAVITTDESGKVKQINKIAEELTGWNEKEAKDHLLTTVFKIINENTREIVENPVDKVLKNGSIVGLANHTLLISRNGKETPIADSAAPIRNNDGKIIGVVLVFRDQSEEKRHFDEMKSSRDFANNIIETLHEGLLVLDANLKIVSANQTFYSSFGFQQGEVVGKDFFSIGEEACNQKELRELLENILPQNTKFDDFEITCHFETIGTRVLNMNARRIYANDKKTKNILLAINDITEKQKLIEELIVAKEKAEENNNLKTAFLANMSHEIRTPLNGILGFSNLILDENLKAADKKRFISIIEDSGQRLLSIVNDILDISLIQSNQIKIKPQQFEIKSFLDETFTFYKTLKQEQLSTIEFICLFDSENQQLMINTDKNRVFQILKNLLDNAFKFTYSGFIHFGAIQSDHEIKFYVKDSGKGIPNNQLEMIFEKFQQIDSAKGKQADGTGLGLAIAKGLVDQLGGKIWVETEINKGAEFYFSIPLN
ncbi:sensor histidine kinase [Sunxiuqinia sp. A32]|uniref:sensor histidine kinase n=1 Tax=Sunxiuqinia sp. A32 TaxID=3461496 RepID=UPI0040460192